MARTTATNFAGGLQFPYATAATDLFKKEDLQTLAQAVDQHDHSSGKGLVLAAASIPNGSVTLAKLAADSVDSSKILDGTIATADIAANAITQYVAAVGTTNAPTTTSSAPVDLPEMSVTLTTTGGKLLALLTVVLSLTGTIGNNASLQLSIDGGDIAASQRTWTPSLAAYSNTLTLLFDLSGYAGISHTIKGRWSVSGSGSTLTANGTLRTLIVMELKR